MSDLDQASYTLLQKSLFPTRDRRGRRIQQLLDAPIRQTLGQQENQASSKYIARRQPTRLRNLLQLRSLFRRQCDCFRSEGHLT
jgi:hypothetical protein